jgi:hypothetical protein
MKTDYLIIPECYADTNLIETIVPPSQQKGYNHQMGCNNVASKMQNDLKDCFALGIIDKDKKSIGYLNEFETIDQRNNLFLYKHKTRHHYIIQISPAIEKFILDEAATFRVNLEEFELSNNLEKLKQVTKKVTSKKEPRLTSLFKKLNSFETSQFKTLSYWIGYLKENTYQTNIETLKNQ